MTLGRPAPNEYPPFASKYVSHVSGEDPVDLLIRNAEVTRDLLQSVGEEGSGFSYEPGKWTIKEVICHLSDAERIFSTRILRIARGDKTPLPPFEQDQYVSTSEAASRSLASLVSELTAVRASTLALLTSLPEEAWLRQGTVSSHPCTVRGITFVLAGHELHHLHILKERYLPVLLNAEV